MLLECIAIELNIVYTLYRHGIESQNNLRRMEIMRKLLAVLLALMMVFSFASFASAEEEPITVTVFRGDPGDQPTDDNKMYKLIEEEFGIKFEIEFLAGDLDEIIDALTLAEQTALMNAQD